MDACPEGAISFTDDYRLAVSRREDLVVRGNQDALPLASEPGAELRRLLGWSLKLRQVSAGGCNGRELDTNVLNTVGWDLGRFGVQFVASPRHADGPLITGAVSQNMKVALEKSYDAIPAPKIVIAVGACAIGGGPFVGHAEVNDGATDLLPIDLLIPGCPPHPLTILAASSGFWVEWTAGSPGRVRRTSNPALSVTIRAGLVARRPAAWANSGS